MNTEKNSNRTCKPKKILGRPIVQKGSIRECPKKLKFVECTEKWKAGEPDWERWNRLQEEWQERAVMDKKEKRRKLRSNK